MNTSYSQEDFYNQSASLKEPRTEEDTYFGSLIIADSFVSPKVKPDPGDVHTNSVVDYILQDLRINRPKPSDQQKYIFCLSDFLFAALKTQTGYISWPCADASFPAGSAYSKSVAKTVRDALMAQGYLSLIQKQYQKGGLARLYLVDRDKIDSDLQFVRHGKGPVVSVRAAKERLYDQRKKGIELPRKNFVPAIVPLEAQIRAINAVNKLHPLQTSCGEEYWYSRRIFNNGSLKEGGRLYGDWQNIPETERLTMTIDGKGVCEIDLKACYLQIMNAKLGSGTYLGKDPYMKIPYVKGAKTKAEFENRRKLMKLLISAYLCREEVNIGRFPRGEKVADRVTGEVRTVSVKKQFGLGRKDSYISLMDDVFSAYPFLKRKAELDCNITYIESEIMIGAMSGMVAQALPAFPMHDCLIVRKRDSERAVELIQANMHANLGLIFEMDVTYLDKHGQPKTEYPTINSIHKQKEITEDQDDLLDNYDLIDDDDIM